MSHKLVVFLLALFVFAFAVLIIVTATMSDAGRLLYINKADGTLEAELKDTYRDGWFCRDELTVPEQVGGKPVTSVAHFNSGKLKKIVLPNSITEIKAEAFAGCSSLGEIVLGNDLRLVGDGAWKNCPSLHNIIFPDSIQSVGVKIFEGTPINYNKFGGLNYVGNNENPYLVLIGANVPLSEVHVHEGAKIAATAVFENADTLGIVKADTANLNRLPDRMFARCANLEQVKASAVIDLGTSCFENCVKLTQIDLGEDLILIEDRAFSGCSELQSISIPNSTTEIGAYSFMNCSELCSVTIGSNMTRIEQGAFENCDKLAQAYFKNQSGWKVSKSQDMSNAEDVSGLDDPLTAAENLRDVYHAYYWEWGK